MVIITLDQALPLQTVSIVGAEANLTFRDLWEAVNEFYTDTLERDLDEPTFYSHIEKGL